jgi:RNA polymerase sigma factor (sigma-70 family)
MKETAESGPSRRGLFFALVSQHLKSLYHVVRHELGYLQAVGDVLPSELTVDEVVDAVLLSAYREFVKDPRERKVKSWLLGLAREHLRAEVARLKAWRARTPVRTEQDFPDTPPTEWVSTLGDETLDFHELDEDLKVEDVIPDIDAPSPEEQAEIRELQWCVGTALAGMPAEWRRALLLRHVDGLAGVELAKALDRSEPETRRILEQARAYLRQKLVESGCRFKAA